jgi:hypothetical protein
MKRECSPVLAAMKAAGTPLTLDAWLETNMTPDVPLDAEMLETLPKQLHDEFNTRLRFQTEYDKKEENL